MQNAITQGNGTWTEEQLELQIVRLKSGERSEKLILFLQERLEDEDQVCVASRSKLFNEFGLALLRQEDITAAADFFEQALAASPENSNSRYNLANMRLQLNDFDTALAGYCQVLRQHPDHVGALYNSALCYVLQGDRETALPLFVRVTELEPDYAGAQFWAGECLLGSGLVKEALPYFGQAAALNPGHLEAVIGLAIAQYEASQFTQALATCDRLLTHFAPSLLALRIRGDSLLALDRTEEAALCHLEMAYFDFDAREFLVARAQRLAIEDSRKARHYTRMIVLHFPDLEASLAITGDCGSSAAIPSASVATSRGIAA